MGNTFDTKAGQLRQSIDSAQDAVTQAEALVKQTKERLELARKDYLDHILTTDSSKSLTGY